MTSLNLSAGVPVFENALILSLAKKSQVTKRELAKMAMDCMGRPSTDEAVFLRHIDCLITAQQMVKMDYRFFVTPSGFKRLDQLKSELRNACDILIHGA